MDENEMQWQWLANSYGADDEEETLSQKGNFRLKKALTLAEKIEVIKMAETTTNTRYLARTFGCGRTQIQNILRHRQDYLDEWRNNGNPYRVRRKRSIALITVGTIAYEWIQRCRNNGIAITDADIRQTAQRVANILHMPEFRPHNRWLERLKRKYKLTDLDWLGLNPDVNGSGVTKESIKVDDIIADLRNPGNVKNVSVSLYIEEKLSSLSTTSNHIDELKHSNSEPEPECEYQSDDDMPIQLNIEKTGDVATYGKKSENTNNTQKVTSYKEALNHLGPLEHFALMEEDIRAVGLINQLENLFREKMKL